MKISLRFTASIGLALIMGTAGFGQHYTRINLASSTAGVARITDPQLVNPWGMYRRSLIVAIPQADPNNKNTPTGTPTGAIFNSSQTDFLLAPGKPARFLFSTIDGTIVGWNPSVAVAQGTALPSRQAVTVVKAGKGSSYTGLTSAFIDGKPYLYVANFTKGRVDVYDSAFHPVRLSGEDPNGNRSGNHAYFSEDSFVDESVSRPYSPFNVQAVGNDIVVTYAIHQQQVSSFEIDGPGLGFVDIYSSTGRLLLRLEHGDWLNAPWGVALAPADFGRFSHNLLIGQFAGGGDTQSSGHIAAYDLATGKFNGLLQDASGKPLVIKGIFGHLAPEVLDRTIAIPQPRLPRRCISPQDRAMALEGRSVIWRQFRRRTGLKKHRYGHRHLRATCTYISAPLPPVRTFTWMGLTSAPPLPILT